ncbi:transcriptional regulator [Paraburkholderia sp. SARCC-3016]|uniref:COG4315 family predicted lipoprotein n=1 Tax=Paraburkholderia sp. SARCC-3016 TaxID=3058611 RepID=UPI002809DC68|nr:transcriptional regulator [Paraburkholderia sp. SARCC-3016]MDQ7979887.1 transcriptional regulator [Paraburkholderia sp. SARCC-3016]
MKRFAGIAALLVATSASAAQPHIGDEGMLVDGQGMTLYVFSGGALPDSKACEGDCARNFPPALAEPADSPAGQLGLVTTASGKRQWTFDGKPLYRGLMDKRPGDHAADGLNDAWHSARPQ